MGYLHALAYIFLAAFAISRLVMHEVLSAFLLRAFQSSSLYIFLSSFYHCNLFLSIFFEQSFSIELTFLNNQPIFCQSAFLISVCVLVITALFHVQFVSSVLRLFLFQRSQVVVSKPALYRQQMHRNQQRYTRQSAEKIYAA